MNSNNLKFASYKELRENLLIEFGLINGPICGFYSGFRKFACIIPQLISRLNGRSFFEDKQHNSHENNSCYALYMLVVHHFDCRADVFSAANDILIPSLNVGKV